MVSPVPTTMRAVALALQVQLASCTGLDSSRVRLVARQQVPAFGGEDDLLVRFGPPSPLPGFSHGSGRVAVIVERLVQVTPRVRCSLDESDRDDIALTDASLGLFRLEDLVVDGLHIWVPVSGQDWLLQCPIEWVPGGPPVHEIPVPQGWLHSDLMYRITYQTTVSSNSY